MSVAILSGFVAMKKLAMLDSKLRRLNALPKPSLINTTKKKKRKNQRKKRTENIRTSFRTLMMIRISRAGAATTSP